MLARWREPDVKAVVITGAPAGKYITHYSVEELVQGSAHPEQLRRSFPENIAAWHTLLRNITYLDKAVVAGITGDAGGGGLELSLNCDIRILQRGDLPRWLPRVRPRHPHRHGLTDAHQDHRPRPCARFPAA